LNAGRNDRPLRVGYLSGPADADRMYEDLLACRPATYFGTNYMRQFLILMQELGAAALIETWFGEERSRRQLGPFLFSNVPEPRSSGAGYHLGQAARQIGVLARFMRFRPDVVVLTGKQGYWWLLAPLRLFGTRFIASFHCVLWRRFGRTKWHERFLLSLERALVLRHLAAVVSTSRAISEQFTELVGDKRIPLFEHLPSYEASQFADIAPPVPASGRPFRVLFTGRIEANKGVYDVVEIARQLARERPGEFAFDLCGDGTELANLRQQVTRQQLDEIVHLHGYCTPDRLKAVMRESQAVIVPTRSDFVAGFEMTCAEAILSKRPLVTSAVCPALDYLGPASIEVRPDAVEEYKQAIVRLKDEPDLFAAKRDASTTLSAQFFDRANSWEAAMRGALAAAMATRSQPPSAPAVRSR
jgi:glycosyltransferase involved in cell wall biosynthesis